LAPLETAEQITFFFSENQKHRWHLNNRAGKNRMNRWQYQHVAAILRTAVSSFRNPKLQEFFFRLPGVRTPLQIPGKNHLKAECQVECPVNKLFWIDFRLNGFRVMGKNIPVAVLF
jgi:hypothetical protein